MFTSYETHLLEFSSSQEFYRDADHHLMAGISIKELTGPGHLFLGETKVEEGMIYEPYDFIFSPQEPFNSSSSLSYSFIDKSGQESSIYTILFNPAARVRNEIPKNFRIYPVPAKESCMIEFPPDLTGPADIVLFDLNGKILKSLQLKNTGGVLTIDLSAFESGMYFYMIKTRKDVINGKIEIIK